MLTYDLYSSCGGVPPDRLLIWLDAIYNTDVTELVCCLKSADDILIDSLNNPSFDYGSFKHYLATQFTCANIVDIARERFVEWFHGRNLTILSDLRSFLLFITRLNLPGLADLEEKALADYLATEERLSSVYPTRTESIIINNWFPRRSEKTLFDHFHPHFGNGSTAFGKLSPTEKYLMLGYTDLTYYLSKHVDDHYPVPTNMFYDNFSKTIFVPKSIDKLRTISMEIPLLNWWQEGFFVSLNWYFQHHSYLRRRIKLDQQEQNRELARLGSLDGAFATIDLSSASDSVSYRLVLDWFSNSGLWRILRCTRSKRTLLPDGSFISLNKYAPMGSALCFPIECIVFAAIIEAAIMDCGDKPSESNYSVYGDDLIVEKKYCQAVFHRLDENGFLLNKQKTHTEIGDFIYRESCGVEYVNGISVAPLRISRKFSGYNVSSHTPNRILNLVDMANRFSRYPSVRRLIINHLLRLPKKLRPLFSNSCDVGIKSPNPTNWHLIHYLYDSDVEFSGHANSDHNYMCDAIRHGQAITHDIYHYDSTWGNLDDLFLAIQLQSTMGRKRLLFPEDAYHFIRSPGPLRWTSVKSVDNI